jgi:4-amino-4-deoxy-L-arabinose transferase-like glycosyltransferase
VELSKTFKRYEILLLAFLLIFGLFLRIWKIDRAPIELFGDEIDAGIQAYSILKTGKDIFSNSYPIIFHSFSEYRLPVQIYSMVATIWIFGLNEVGVRFASVFFGLLSIIAIYLVTRELISKKIAFIAAFFLSISPWHLQFSRQANDSGFLLPFVLFGLWFFIKGLKKDRKSVV